MRPRRQWLTPSRWMISLAVLAAWTSRAAEESELELDLPAPPSPWFHELNARTGLGYRDNVSLASVAPVGSGFLSTGFEAFLSRLPIDPTSIDCLILFDDLRYFRSEPVDGERLGFVQLSVKRDLSDAWQFSLGTDYLYQDQVLDVSTTEALLNTVQVEGHGMTLRPGVRLRVHPKFFLTADWSVNRQFYRAPLDDYWENGPRVGFELDYGHRSDLTVTYESHQRRYDDYQELDENGNEIAGTRRAFDQQDFKIALRHYYDSNRHWRSTFKLGVRVNEDNGSGYFDYTRIGGSHQLMFRASGWEARADVGYAHYQYDVQRANGPGSPRRQRDEVVLSLRAEKLLATFVKAFAQYDYEKTTSNEEFFDYDINTVSAGLIWIF